jgi:hypothetical protein
MIYVVAPYRPEIELATVVVVLYQPEQELTVVAVAASRGTIPFCAEAGCRPYRHSRTWLWRWHHYTDLSRSWLLWCWSRLDLPRPDCDDGGTIPA